MHKTGKARGVSERASQRNIKVTIRRKSQYNALRKNMNIAGFVRDVSKKVISKCRPTRLMIAKWYFSRTGNLTVSVAVTVKNTD
jgi:hypothetical protein